LSQCENCSYKNEESAEFNQWLQDDVCSCICDDCVIELDLIRCHTCSNAGEPKHFKKVGQVSTSPVKGFGKMVDVYQCIDYCIDGKVSIPDEDEVV
jgi:hypothetical protein